jgi:hypothetical protein
MRIVSPCRSRAALLAVAAVLGGAGAADAAPPVLQSKSAVPLNPRTSTPVRFFAFGNDPDNTKIQYQWDFGSGFGTLSDNSAFDHTFSSDGIHPVSVRLQDAAGESVTGRFQLATHAENWNPAVYMDSHVRAVAQNLPTRPDPRDIRGPSWLDDSPSAGQKATWDVNGDGVFNGPGDGSQGYTGPDRKVTFSSDGDHPVKVKVDDGEGGETIFTWTVRTHTANEAPYLYEAYLSTLDQGFVLSRADISGGSAYLQTSWLDDYSNNYHGFPHSWKLDGNTVDGETDGRLAIPANLPAGEHTAVVTVSDLGHNPGDSEGSPGGPVKSNSATFKFTVVEQRPARILAESRLDIAPDPSTFRPLENAWLFAFAPSGQTATWAEWDFDGDGDFDDTSGLQAFFAAAAPGTYPVAARIRLKTGAEVTATRELTVAVPGAGGRPTGPGTGPGAPGTAPTSPGGGLDPKAAMTSLLSAGTLKFLQAIGGLNKKGLDAKKPVLNLGELGAKQLPNGGTGQFDVYDKPGAKTARAAAAKRKKLGSTKVTVAKGQKKKVVVKLNARGKALLKKKGKAKLTVEATLTDAATGAKVTRAATITVKVKKKKRQ